MPCFGRSVLVAAVLVCLFVPSRVQAAIIPFNGSLEFANEVDALATFDAAAGTTLFVSLNTAVDPILTLFLVGAGSDLYKTDSDASDFFVDGYVLLDAGTYRLTLTQYPNFFDPFGDPPGFEVTADTQITAGAYSGDITLQTAVPEPATLSLVAIGASALWCRRRIRHRHGSFRRRPSS